MQSKLQQFLLLEKKEVRFDTDCIYFNFYLTQENKDIIEQFQEEDYIENICSLEGYVLTEISENINKTISLAFVLASLKGIGFYENFKEFILHNRHEIPDEYHIVDIANKEEEAGLINKYKAITSLIKDIKYKAKFSSNDTELIYYLFHENSFIDISIDNIPYEEQLSDEDIDLIYGYLEDIKPLNEKKSIFQKELIDFLKDQPITKRFSYLVTNFKEFYERCNTSFEYYLSNFSYNKIKLELDSAVLDYSKNIRTIINDSQSKLIAIPAAFILGASQINYSLPLSSKNLIIVTSAFLFSYIISVFINNQKLALEIINDNLKDYTFRFENKQLVNKSIDFFNLSNLVNKSFEKVRIELIKQKQALLVLQISNWGISLILLFSILMSKFEFLFDF